MPVIINSSQCIGCGCCSDGCSSGALELDDKAIMYEEHCVACFICVDMCPAAAITVEQ